MVQVTISVGARTFDRDLSEVPTVGSVVPIQPPWQISPVVMTIKKVIVECDLPAGSNTGMLDFYREESAARSATQPDEVDLLVPTPRPGSVSGLSGREYIPDAKGIIRVLRDDARPLKLAGYVEVKVAWRAGFVSD
jgi:hypothetical protein